MHTASLQTCTISIGEVRAISRDKQNYILLGTLEIMVMLPLALLQFLYGLYHAWFTMLAAYFWLSL
jgi:hypothetical protein